MHVVGDNDSIAWHRVRRLGFRVDGVTSPADHGGQAAAPTAWIQRR